MVHQHAALPPPCLGSPAAHSAAREGPLLEASVSVSRCRCPFQKPVDRNLFLWFAACSAIRRSDGLPKAAAQRATTMPLPCAVLRTKRFMPKLSNAAYPAAFWIAALANRLEGGPAVPELCGVPTDHLVKMMILSSPPRTPRLTRSKRCIGPPTNSSHETCGADDVLAKDRGSVQPVVLLERPLGGRARRRRISTSPGRPDTGPLPPASSTYTSRTKTSSMWADTVSAGDGREGGDDSGLDGRRGPG